MGVKLILRAQSQRDNRSSYIKFIENFFNFNMKTYFIFIIFILLLGSHNIALCESTESLLEKAQGLANSGHFEEAVKLFTKVIKRSPKNSEAYSLRGDTYLVLRMYDKAMSDYNKSVQLNPKNPSAYYNRGVLYYMKLDYQMALKDFNKVIELSSDSAFSKYAEGVYYNRGQVYGQLGEFRKAIEDFSRAIELNPKNANAYYNRAVMYRKVGDKKKALEALEDTKTAARLGDKQAQELLKSSKIKW